MSNNSKQNRFNIKFLLVIIFLSISSTGLAQLPNKFKWSKDGNSVYTINEGGIEKINLENGEKSILIPKENLATINSLKSYEVDESQNKVLLFGNAKRVWRYETRGDYWIYDLEKKSISQIGISLPSSTLMFAKLSPDGKYAAYVSNHNIYLEDLGSKKISQLTHADPNSNVIYGTFDWAYEEEFSCLDGFSWSEDSKKIAFWKIDASKIRNYLMLNTTDSIYSKTIPVEYPKVGKDPSSCKIGVINIDNLNTTWLKVPGDDVQNYIPRMQWAPEKDKIILQQLNRKQNKTILYKADTNTGICSPLLNQTDAAWVDVRGSWGEENNTMWNWINNGKNFLWISEKGGWNQIYQYDSEGKNEKLITKENFDIINPVSINAEKNEIYFYASPNISTDQYLYSINYKNGSKAKLLSPSNQKGTHRYKISPNGKYAFHEFSNHFTPNKSEWITLEDHQPILGSEGIAEKYDPEIESNVDFFTITTEDGISLDGWMAKPNNFDPNKKYPVLFYVYAEPAGLTSSNTYYAGKTSLYNRNLAEDGYFYISIDGRGSPAPKGREWRKSIYKNIGIVNIRDQAMGCKKLLELHPYLDPDRVAVHGWSGGGSTTLNLLFQYPEIYQTGIAVAAVANQLSYDNIYQERYMGVPPEDLDAYIKGSPITYAKNLKGNLLYIHGTGDDNVHYQNAELLLNELIKHNKQFQFMAYPNRSHGIYEGEGTRRHLSELFTKFLNEKCPPGAK